MIASISLFALTIRQYRTNRVVVLGGIAVMVFFAFIFCVTLVNNPHVPSWAAPAAFVFVVADVRCWLKDQWKAGIADGGPGKHETK